MNDRIKKLADQASENISYRIDPHTLKHIDDPNGPYIRVEFNKEKFAELIVEECCKSFQGYTFEEIAVKTLKATFRS